MFIEEKIKQNIPLASLTTFKIGGSAKYFVEVNSKEDLPGAFAWAKEKKQATFILGGGSNVLINDKGVDGLVINLANQEVVVRGVRLECGAGASLARTVGLAVSHNLSGLEWAVGIPGTVGGAVRGNAGAFGKSMADVLEIAEVFHQDKMIFESFSNKNCCFDYRESIFKKDKRYLVWQAILKLRSGQPAQVKQAVDNYLSQRGEKHPRLPSAGSVFKNLEFKELYSANQALAEQGQESGAVRNGKIGAGWIISQLDLKGKTIGGAKISLEHANFIVNTGKATASEVAMLISFIKQQVRDKLGVQLKEEIQYLGF